ncbi:PAS domain-containing protein [Methylobacterium mesophilicum]|uniref:PAS domain-containing protein n=1 Tax=Methylobacterium mesophilicum TaxID=39956 RepID=UPI001FCE9F4D|nr:PAS domain-containing protein [Methylobacterium mesophilicum]
MPEALAASNVGTWRTGQTVQHYITDETAAALFGLDPEQAAEGVPLLNYSRAVHPADRAVFHEKIDRVTEYGGLFVIEYRTMPRAGALRWVLARGRYERDPLTGEMQGRGILIDITESKLDGHVEDRALFIKPHTHKHPLDRAADLAVETRQAIDQVGGHEGQALRHAIDALLWLLGRTLARRNGRRPS